MESFKEKFLRRNKESFDKLNKTIDEGEGKQRVVGMLVSVEMWKYLKFQKEHCDFKENDFDRGIMKYKGVKVNYDSYLPGGAVLFMRASDVVGFEVPCMCGIYSDEKHP